MRSPFWPVGKASVGVFSGRIQRVIRFIRMSQNTRDRERSAGLRGCAARKNHGILLFRLAFREECYTVVWRCAGGKTRSCQKRLFVPQAQTVFMRQGSVHACFFLTAP